MNFQMINFYKGRMGGLVSSGMKNQMVYNCRDEKHILPFLVYLLESKLFNLPTLTYVCCIVPHRQTHKKTLKISHNRIKRNIGIVFSGNSIDCMVQTVAKRVINMT
jgi:hypothetical protein